MKPPKPELHNTRIIRLASRFCSLPYVFARAVCAGIGRLWQRGKSGERLRSEDQLRQSRARRELRGLPPDHVQTKGHGA